MTNLTSKNQNNSDTLALQAIELSKIHCMYNSPADRLKQMFWRERKQLFTPFVALSDVSFELRRGEVLGIVGRNGAGKSTLLQLICGTLTPTSGSITRNGRLSALLELGAGFDPEFTGKENIYLNAAVLGLTRTEVDSRLDDILNFASIGDHINQPVKTYSSGMYVRLAFAISIAIEPDILVVDEALSVGDELFQRKCYARIRDLRERGTTILFVSHSAQTIMQLCDRALLLEKGQLLLDASPKVVMSYYHKLIYAPEDKVDTVKNEILLVQAGEQKADTSQATTTHPSSDKENAKNSSNNSNGVSAETSDSNNKLQSAFDPNLVPESTIIHEENGAVIHNPYFTDEEGTRVNMMVRRNWYNYHFDIETKVECSNIRANIRIRTATGVVIAGTNTVALDKNWQTIAKNKKIHVTFRFQCLLVPGSYFTEIGCSSTAGEQRTPLTRISDASVFKVLPEEGLHMGGIADLMFSAEMDSQNKE